MPTAWRIVKTARAASAFDGEGARLFGGRWNSPGTPMVYTAESQSLAALELLVHLHTASLLSHYSAIPVSFDDGIVEPLPASALPPDWRSHPAPAALREMGDRWVAELRSAVLRVPSAIVPRECNYLLNPEHPQFESIEVGQSDPFEFDPRLG